MSTSPYKRSEFTELQGDTSVPLNAAGSAVAATPTETKLPMPQLQVDENEMDQVPVEELWSWNPLDW